MDFLKANAGKIAVVAIILVGAGFFFARNAPKSPQEQLASHFTYVCVETGEVFKLPRGPTRIPPVENPKTGRRTLISAVEENGELRIDPRDAPLLDDLGELNKYVDRRTLKVRSKPSGEP